MKMCKSVAELQGSVNGLMRGVLSRGTLATAAIAAFLFLTACQQDGTLNGAGSSAGDVSAEVMEVMVGPVLLECVGAGPRKCLEVNGELFYESIVGFEYEEGYNYRLKIEQYDASPGEEGPPQDASRYGYRLIEVLRKTAQ